MTSSSASGAQEEAARLEELLREQGLGAGEIGADADTLANLAIWRAPLPSAADSDRLVQQLLPLLPAPAMRPARRAPRTTLPGECRALLDLVATQIGIFRPAFWLSSAVVMLLGVVAVGGMNVPPAFALSVSGPLLSYLGTASAFRGAALGTLEFELACPPSVRQLTLARLVLIIGYDTALTLAGSGLLWLWSGDAPLALTLQWLAPLLLVAGLTLVLSLRLAVAKAAAVTYVAWLIFLTPRWLQGGVGGAVPPTASMDVLLGAAGLALLVAAVFATPAASVRLLPHH